jgi:hypothetical protein
MDRFVKGSWDEPEIPEAVYLRARRRAWDRIQAPGPAGPRRLRWAAAALVPAAALMAWLALPGPLAEAPPPPSVSFVPEVRVPPPAVVARSERVAAARAAHRRAGGVKLGRREDERDRLVLNFVLPESGVRMIWILDRSFQVDGGNE